MIGRATPRMPSATWRWPTRRSCPSRRQKPCSGSSCTKQPWMSFGRRRIGREGERGHENAVCTSNPLLIAGARRWSGDLNSAGGQADRAAGSLQRQRLRGYHRRPNRPPQPPPKRPPPAKSLMKKEQYDCSNCGVDDEGNGTDAKMDTQARQQPVTDECADNTDNQVANKPEAATSHDLARQPAGNDADHQYDDEAFI